MVTLNELLLEEHWGAYGSNEEVERNSCKATQDAQTRERDAADNETASVVPPRSSGKMARKICGPDHHSEKASSEQKI